MPRALRTFPNLASIGLFNLTLVDWNASATFAPEQASLSTIEFALVNLSGIPEALLQPSLPSALIDIEFSHTNLTSLPANLHEFWPSMEVLYLEYSEIREVPETLLHMDLFDVSLAGNHLENVSRLADGRPGAAYLSLCFNPLQSLPETIPSTSLFSSLAFLNLHHTQVRRMPEWINTIPADSVLAVGTPFCEDESETRAADFSVVCSGDNDRQNGSFPFAFVMGNLDPAL
ncbi:TPA: hypothetical protein N0F65_000805 [Lagenidium giganteum]|uniref:Uncharacterized protein n=1 Tax=Lagenidium giganteum TaxID=4803 RepID=A0AAV2ZK33_9STRA|nr:TPA: hypothetical protein N0F65_000805 [Lagenidium giganteum]